MRLLVPTDFSDNAMQAALYAAEIAKRTKSTIFLLHAVQIGAEAIGQPFQPAGVYHHTDLKNREAAINQLKESMLVIYPGMNITAGLTDGVVVDSILQYAQSNAIDMIIMGTKGTGNIKERLLGTTAAAVTAQSKVPVLVVPEDYSIEQPDGIVFTTSHFEKDPQQLAMIMTMAKLFSAAVHAVVFVDEEKSDAVDYLDKGRSMEQYLSFLKKYYPDIQFTGELIEGRDFENAIRLYHTTHETDLTAMISYPKEFWDKLVHPSTTKKMIFHSRIPVLAIPARDKTATR